MPVVFDFLTNCICFRLKNFLDDANPKNKTKKKERKKEKTDRSMLEKSNFLRENFSVNTPPFKIRFQKSCGYPPFKTSKTV